MMEQLAGKNIVVYDTEIRNEIDGKKITWADHNLMGLSVACLFDYRDGDHKVYFQEDIQELAQRINDADLAVGFNTPPFDDKLIRGMGGDLKPADMIKSYDILEYSRRAIGWTPEKRFPMGMNLDEHLKATFGPQFVKTAHGSEAPRMWQAGQIGKLVSYCLGDLRREVMTFEQIVKNGFLVTATHGKRYLDLTPIHRAMGV